MNGSAPRPQRKACSTSLTTWSSRRWVSCSSESPSGGSASSPTKPSRTCRSKGWPGTSARGRPPRLTRAAASDIRMSQGVLLPRRKPNEAGTSSPFRTGTRTAARGTRDCRHPESKANGGSDSDAAATGEDAPEDRQEDEHDVVADRGGRGRGASLRRLHVGRDGRRVAGRQSRLRHHPG